MWKRLVGGVRRSLAANEYERYREALELMVAAQRERDDRPAVEPGAMTVVLPAPFEMWGDSEVASLVGQRVYLDVGPHTFIGKVTFAGASGAKCDDLCAASHVELRVAQPTWATTGNPVSA